MVPPKKKRKVVVPVKKSHKGNDDDNEKSFMTIISVQDKVSRKNLLTKELITRLDDLESAPEHDGGAAAAGVSMGLLKLKSLQRNLLEKIRETQKVLREQALSRDQQERKLDNLGYQYKIHQTSERGSDVAIEETSKRIAELVRKSQKSENNDESEAVGGDDNDAADDDNALLTKFLGDNWKDPSRRQAIVSKLHKEVTARKLLEDQRNKLGVDRTAKKESLAAREKILKDLPSKLAEMEKASLPLQKFFQKQSTSLVEANPKLGTTKRRARLELAASLPKALYTLFHQLQSCLDAMESQPQQVAGAVICPEAMPTVEVERSLSSSSEMPDVVLLKIPIPTISGGGGVSYKTKKQATISFRYVASPDVLLAACGTDHFMGQAVIGELFPGDIGEFLPNAKSISEGASTIPGEAYRWCNYLGGLHVAPAEQTAAKTHASARVIVGALVRRVRATTTLSWIVHSFSRKPTAPSFPGHASLNNGDDGEASSASGATRLSSWSEVSPASSKSISNATDSGKQHVRVYEAVLRHSGGGGGTSKSVTAKVSVDTARYPSVVPRWKLQENGMSLDSELGGAPRELPLYNEELARLERDANHVVDRLVDPSDQTTYDWILAQQLVEIAKGWEDSLQEDAP